MNNDDFLISLRGDKELPKDIEHEMNWHWLSKDLPIEIVGIVYSPKSKAKTQILLKTKDEAMTLLEDLDRSLNAYISQEDGEDMYTVCVPKYLVSFEEGEKDE